MSIVKTTGIVISNKYNVGDKLARPDSAVPDAMVPDMVLPNTTVQSVSRSLKRYNTSTSLRKNSCVITLWVDGNVRSFQIFDDIKCLIGHKVTLVQDGESVIHVVNHTLGVKSYIGPESLCSYYDTEVDSNLTPKSIFKILAAQLFAGATGLCLMTLMAASSGYIGYLNNSYINGWLVNVLLSIVVVLVTAKLLFKKQNSANSLGRYLSEYQRRVCNVFYLSTIWVYPAFSFAFHSQILSLTVLVVASVLILIIPVLLTKVMISKPSESNCAMSAYKYEQCLEHHMTRISEQEKDVWLYARAA